MRRCFAEAVFAGTVGMGRWLGQMISAIFPNLKRLIMLIGTTGFLRKAPRGTRPDPGLAAELSPFSLRRWVPPE